MRIIKPDGTDATVVLTATGAVPVALGTNTSITIGTVDIDQATPGVSNGVVVNGALPVGSNIIGSMSSAASGVSANAPANSTSTAYEASRVVKASPGMLYGFSGYNARTTPQFILFYNATSVPADTAQAVLVISAAAQSNFSYDPGIYGRWFSAGIAWSNSSTAPTKTIAAADVFLDAQYK